jgi:hypothetical protein
MPLFKGVAALALVLLATGGGDRSTTSRALDVGGTVAFAQQGHAFAIRVTPNSASKWNTVTLGITKHGTPLRRAAVSLTFSMIGMEMGPERFRLPETHPGVYAYFGPAFSMKGRWRLGVDVLPRAGGRISFALLDRARG